MKVLAVLFVLISAAASVFVLLNDTREGQDQASNGEGIQPGASRNSALNKSSITADGIPSPWVNGESPKASSATKADFEYLSQSDGFTSVEESGPDITGSTTDELLNTMRRVPSADKTAIRSAWELGNRAIYKGLVLTDRQANEVADIVSDLVDDERLGDSKFYSNSREQIYRLWSLAHPGLLQALRPQRKHKDLIVKSLAATRTPSLINAILEQYTAETDPQRKALLAFTLSCMKEQRRIGIPRRNVMSMEESVELYKLINPVIQLTK